MKKKIQRCKHIRNSKTCCILWTLCLQPKKKKKN